MLLYEYENCKKENKVKYIIKGYYAKDDLMQTRQLFFYISMPSNATKVRNVLTVNKVQS